MTDQRRNMKYDLLERLAILSEREYSILSDRQQNEVGDITMTHGLGYIDELIDALTNLPAELVEHVMVVLEAYPGFGAMRRDINQVVAAGPSDDDWWEFSHPDWEGMTGPPDDADREWTAEEKAMYDQYQAAKRAQALVLAATYRGRT